MLALRVDGHTWAGLDDRLDAYNRGLSTPLVDRRTWGTTRAEWDAMMTAFPPAPPRNPEPE